MIKIENTEVVGWEAAIRGMRNPMNSWDRSDSGYGCSLEKYKVCTSYDYDQCYIADDYVVGHNDHDLMTRLANGGPVHAKYRRMITVYVDVTAPLYWWKEFDTYKVGTVANSCSTMHKIHAKEFVLDDFSIDHLSEANIRAMEFLINTLNEMRNSFLTCPEDGEILGMNKKDYWWQMIQLLPSSYNQKRTIMLNYEVLANIYHWRKNHKLDEWREFCKWIESLPYSELITGEQANEN